VAEQVASYSLWPSLAVAAAAAQRLAQTWPAPRDAVAAAEEFEAAAGAAVGVGWAGVEVEVAGVEVVEQGVAVVVAVA
jgi:hypothetical protein